MSPALIIAITLFTLLMLSLISGASCKPEPGQ